MKIIVIGGGNMGFTYAQGIKTQLDLSSGSITIIEKSESRSEFLKDNGFEVSDDLGLIKTADVVLIAVKPQNSQELFEQIKPLVNDKQIFISIMAGVLTKTIQSSLNVDNIVRAMPNLPSQLGLGVTGYFADQNVNQKDLGIVKNILATTGEIIALSEEEGIDKITGISGSGPAYVFYFMHSLMEQAKAYGFSEEASKLMVCQTFEGAVKQFKESDIDLVTWMDRVASKGGTTRKALDYFDAHNTKEIIKKAANASYERAVEMGKK